MKISNDRLIAEINLRLSVLFPTDSDEPKETLKSSVSSQVLLFFNVF